MPNQKVISWLHCICPFECLIVLPSAYTTSELQSCHENSAFFFQFTKVWVWLLWWKFRNSHYLPRWSGAPALRTLGLRLELGCLLFFRRAFQLPLELPLNWENWEMKWIEGFQLPLVINFTNMTRCCRFWNAKQLQSIAVVTVTIFCWNLWSRGVSEAFSFALSFSRRPLMAARKAILSFSLMEEMPSSAIFVDLPVSKLQFHTIHILW